MDLGTKKSGRRFSAGTQKVLEVAVHERMSQSEKAKGKEEPTNSQGRSTEKMKNKPRDDRAENIKVLFQSKTYEFQDENFFFWRQTLPFEGSVVPA